HDVRSYEIRNFSRVPCWRRRLPRRRIEVRPFPNTQATASKDCGERACPRFPVNLDATVLLLKLSLIRIFSPVCLTGGWDFEMAMQTSAHDVREMLRKSGLRPT